MREKFNLKPWHHDIIRLYYEVGYTYKEITKILEEKYGRKFNESTIRFWMMRGGYLDQAWKDYIKEKWP